MQQHEVWSHLEVAVRDSMEIFSQAYPNHGSRWPPGSFDGQCLRGSTSKKKGGALTTGGARHADAGGLLAGYPPRVDMGGRSKGYYGPHVGTIPDVRRTCVRRYAPTHHRCGDVLALPKGRMCLCHGPTDRAGQVAMPGTVGENGQGPFLSRGIASSKALQGAPVHLPGEMARIPTSVAPFGGLGYKRGGARVCSG